MNIPAMLHLNQFRPIGNFSFSFSKKTTYKADGSICLYMGECVTMHLPFYFTDADMKPIYDMMKKANTDILYDGLHCFTTGNNCLAIIRHPLITEWIKNNF